jgi:hypothetical protein
MININEFKLIVNEENRNKFGEVFTDINLISEMLIHLKYWSDPEQTYYDPTCGYGYFLFFVYDILMGNGFKYRGYEEVVGLKYIIKDESKREKHIIENMIYGTDIQQSSIDQCIKLFKGDVYKTNFKAEDFMEYKSESKYNNIIGNPPFEDYRGGKRKAKNHNLWRPIIMKSFGMLKEDGCMAFVCPQSWMSASKTNSEMFDLFNRCDILALNINECRKYFKGVGSSFSYFVINNSKTQEYSTNVICEYSGNNYNSNVTFGSKNKFFPLLLNAESMSIIDKTILSKVEKFNLNFDSSLHAYTKKLNLSKNRNDEFIHKVWHTPNSILWSNIEHPTQNCSKLLIPISTYFEKMIVDISGNTQGMGYIIFDNITDANKLKNILSLKLYRFIVNITRWSNWNSPDILRRLPLVDINQNWDDGLLYKEFGLNKDEINIIEKTIS